MRKSRTHLRDESRLYAPVTHSRTCVRVVRMSGCLYVWLSVCLVLCMSGCMGVARMSGCLYVWLSGCCLYVWLFVCLVVCMSGCLGVARMSGCLDVTKTIEYNLDVKFMILSDYCLINQRPMGGLGIVLGTPLKSGIARPTDAYEYLTCGTSSPFFLQPMRCSGLSRVFVKI